MSLPQTTLEEQLVDAIISTISRTLTECTGRQRSPSQEQYETLAQGLHFLDWNGTEGLYQKLVQGWLVSEQCAAWMQTINATYPREALPLALFCAVQTDAMEHNIITRTNRLGQSHYQQLRWDHFGKKLVPHLYPDILLDTPCMPQILTKAYQRKLITFSEYNSLINLHDVHQNLNQNNDYDTFQYLVREFKNPAPTPIDIEVKSDVFVQP